MVQERSAPPGVLGSGAGLLLRVGRSLLALPPLGFHSGSAGL
ncbi:hypothetical protein [Streptomyces murinus]